ncbi:hypothetical protein ACSSV1_002382 [Labrenzia sp. MBR-25]|jgi:hypothetical protein
MFSPRPAYPRGFYLFGAFVAGALLITSALRPEPQAVDERLHAGLSSSPQIYALELAR